MKNKIIEILILVVLFISLLMISPLITNASTNFKDINEDFWAKESIDVLVQNKILNGYPDGSFGPNDTLNKDAYIKMVVTALGYTNIECGKDYWAEPYINKAYEIGVIEDKSASDFSNPISRQEMAVIAVKALKNLTYSQYLSAYKYTITDYDEIEAKYQEDILKCIFHGIITGYPNGAFMPLNSCSRAEAAKVVHRIIDKTERDKSKMILAEVDEEFEAIVNGPDKDKYIFDDFRDFYLEDGLIIIEDSYHEKHVVPTYKYKTINRDAYKAFATLVKGAVRLDGCVRITYDSFNNGFTFRYYGDRNVASRGNPDFYVEFFGNFHIYPGRAEGMENMKIMWHIMSLYPYIMWGDEGYQNVFEHNALHPKMEILLRELTTAIYGNKYGEAVANYILEIHYLQYTNAMAKTTYINNEFNMINDLKVKNYEFKDWGIVELFTEYPDE